ncbi:MAG: hypothetical protein J6E40_06495 [Lachnospiraceae bacterium]|nr:hypothetical protein [Lachnospiraceae bacterium]
MTKMEIAKDSGFEVDKSEINPALKPHQMDAVQWALLMRTDGMPQWTMCLE